LRPALRRALAKDVKIFVAVLGVEAIIAWVVSLLLTQGYLETLRLLLLGTGFVILIVSAIEGTGAPQARLTQGQLYNMSAPYQETVVRNRLAEEQEGFWFMIVGFCFGVTFLAAAVLLSLASSM
jgi:hypothetical protein